MKKFFANPLIAGSSVLFVGTMIANFGNYLYHLLMGRMLGPKDYGVLTSLISLAYLLSIISTTFLTTVVKFVTKYKVKGQFSKIFNLFWGLQKIFSVLGLFLFAAFFILKEKIATFLQLENSFPIVVLGGWMGLSLLSFVNDGTLRGFLKFNFLAFNSVFATILKLTIAIFLVMVGFGVSGALAAIFLGSLLPYFLSFYPLRFLWQYKDGETIEWRQFFGFSFPVLLATLGLTSLYSSDVILVKHFFSPLEAGLYSATSVLGRIVFFASGVVPAVMFPLVSERFENGRKYRHFLTQSLFIVGGESLLITTIYFLFPSPMIKILYGEGYLAALPYLGIFAVFISFYSLSSLLVNFFLSVGETKVAVFCLLAALLQIILIFAFHSSLLQIIKISLVISVLLFVSLVIFLRQSEKE
ncbi:MAG: oligosaccharide flippase family protein [Microgenomates group bacterium]